MNKDESKCFIFDISLLKKFIIEHHRCSEEDLREVIKFAYIQGLREYHKTTTLFRYESFDIDEDIWNNIYLLKFEIEIINELMWKFYFLITVHLETIVEYALLHNPNKLGVIHFESITVMSGSIFIVYKWE